MTCEKPLCQKFAHHKNFTYRKNHSSPNNQNLTLFKFSIYTFSVSLHRLNIHSNIQRLLSFHTYSIVHQNHLRLWGGFLFFPVSPTLKNISTNYANFLHSRRSLRRLGEWASATEMAEIPLCLCGIFRDRVEQDGTKWKKNKPFFPITHTKH